MKETNVLDSKIFRCALAVGACLALSACNNTVSGTLTVNAGSTLQLKDTHGQTVTLNPGNASVVMGSGKVQIKAANTVTGKPDVVELDALKNLLPQYQASGNHMFLAKDTGQPVNINEITINGDSESAEHEGWETCTQVVTVDVPCPPPVVVTPDSKPDPNSGDQDSDQKKPVLQKGAHHASAKHHYKNRQVADACTDSRVVEGHQRIQFHFDGDSFEIQLIITDPTSGAQIASFDGYSYASDRIVDQYLGPCDIH